jgi:hypothetical protein
MNKPTTKRRGADPDVPNKPKRKTAHSPEQKLEQGLEESMAGSDPVSVTQPHPKSDRDKGHGAKRSP